jgi:hypothetical protein
MTWMIAEIPRADRGSIWAAAEQIQRLEPNVSAAAAFEAALLGYKNGAKTSSAELRIARAAADNPAGMFQARR